MTRREHYEHRRKDSQSYRCRHWSSSKEIIRSDHLRCFKIPSHSFSHVCSSSSSVLGRAEVAPFQLHQKESIEIMHPNPTSSRATKKHKLETNVKELNVQQPLTSTTKLSSRDDESSMTEQTSTTDLPLLHHRHRIAQAPLRQTATSTSKWNDSNVMQVSLYLFL